MISSGTIAMLDLSSAKQFQFIGGNLALDFCNTVGGKRGTATREYLGSYFDFAAWCCQAGLIDRARAEACLMSAQRDPRTAQAALARAVALRESMFRIFAAIAILKPPPAADLAILNSQLAHSLGRLQLSPSKDGQGLGWQWGGDASALDNWLGPIAHAAANLLTDPQQVNRLHVCEGDTCGWLFVDSSKNHSRRWCDMRDCGNRAKIRRHRQKHRSGQATTEIKT